MRHYKSAANRRTGLIRFRATEKQKDMFEAASKRAGITLSAWIVERITAAARTEIESRNSRPRET